MAEEKTKNGRSAPSFVHATRVERSYAGPADPVALWAQARTILGVAEAQSDDFDQLQIQKVYEKLCVEILGAEVLKIATAQGDSDK